MLAYINDEDLRARELKKIYEQEGIQVTSSTSRLLDADFLYLGVKGNDFENATFFNDSRVYTLIENKMVAKRCKECDSTYCYLYNDFELIQNNTYLTTEALLAYMVIDNDISIRDSRVLIIGYGNCGIDIAKKLKALQAKVTICNRGYAHKKNVIKNGYQYICLDEISLEHYDYIINTVPVTILSKQILKTKKETAKIYDLASFPYGVKKQDRCSNYYILNSLPSKYAYKSAARLIYKAITKKEDENAKK